MVLDSSKDAAIERATFRAKARNIRATLVDTDAENFDRTVYYTVGSFTRSALSHRVALVYTADGVTAYCDCEGAQSGRICQHIAAALMAEEMPQVEPESAQPWTDGNFISNLMDPGAF